MVLKFYYIPRQNGCAQDLVPYLKRNNIHVPEKMAEVESDIYMYVERRVQLQTFCDIDLQYIQIRAESDNVIVVYDTNQVNDPIVSIFLFKIVRNVMHVYLVCNNKRLKIKKETYGFSIPFRCFSIVYEGIKRLNARGKCSVIQCVLEAENRVLADKVYKPVWKFDEETEDEIGMIHMKRQVSESKSPVDDDIVSSNIEEVVIDKSTTTKQLKQELEHSPSAVKYVIDMNTNVSPSMFNVITQPNVSPTKRGGYTKRGSYTKRGGYTKRGSYTNKTV